MIVEDSVKAWPVQAELHVMDELTWEERTYNARYRTRFQREKAGAEEEPVYILLEFDELIAVDARCADLMQSWTRLYTHLL